jgi:hypothetical protein
MFGSSRKEVMGWRKLYIEKLHTLYSSPIIKMTAKSRRLKQTGHVYGWSRGEM